LIERELAVLVGVFLRRNGAARLVIVNLITFPSRDPRWPVDISLNGVGFIPVFELEVNALFQPQRPAWLKGL